MDRKNKLVESLMYEIRWYYRAPFLVAVIGVILALIALYLHEIFLLFSGGCLFFVGLGAQIVLGFDYFNWKWKK
ncbi:hypothetical protein QPF19_004354 [Salmonella enterica]|nr:hypothetical protein [Salmonella enterica]